MRATPCLRGRRRATRCTLRRRRQRARKSASRYLRWTVGIWRSRPTPGWFAGRSAPRRGPAPRGVTKPGRRARRAQGPIVFPAGQPSRGSLSPRRARFCHLTLGFNAAGEVKAKATRASPAGDASLGASAAPLLLNRRENSVTNERRLLDFGGGVGIADDDAGLARRRRAARCSTRPCFALLAARPSHLAAHDDAAARAAARRSQSSRSSTRPRGPPADRRGADARCSRRRPSTAARAARARCSTPCGIVGLRRRRSALVTFSVVMAVRSPTTTMPCPRAAPAFVVAAPAA